MKTIKLFSLASIALIGLALPVWAGPHGGGRGFGGGGFAGGARAASAFYRGGFRGAPTFRSNSAYFAGRSVGAISRAPRFYYRGARFPEVRHYAFTTPTRRSTSPYLGRVASANGQPDRAGAITGPNRVSDPRTSVAANRQSFLTNHASERHDANWHHDWDRHHAHFDRGRVFVFIDGFWWGLDPGYYPWDDYPYYGDGYPYDYYYGNSYDSDNYYPYDHDDQPASAASDPYKNQATVSAVQAQLEKLGYFSGTIDGVLGDQTEAAVARYQEDHDLSVTGLVDAATVQSLGIR